ncbi:MAG: methyltransferase domain-containing protein [Chloroflexi bacterium]|nr:methyltransferase domain-containing protein [Chloroflexota bacterium]MYF91229.1 methyltransferase domain-containing protein [Gemmatimonadota bacterium]MYK60971.1 methyltransferase domain-containing protein [Chloroflexota bacterium]
MPFKLSKILKDDPSASDVGSDLREYEDRYRTAQRGGMESKAGASKEFTDLYYDLVTDFYEYGWGRSFHFAPRIIGESFKESLIRHEHFLAEVLELKPGMVVADFGCGIGGPLLEIAQFSGAKIIGVNINAYQLERARRLVENAGMSDMVDFLHCDFTNVEAPDQSFDSVYGIETTCCAPDKVSVYGEAFRLLKPGGGFGAYEYVLTDRFNATDPHHLQIKADLELGGGLLDIDDEETINDALRTVGFEVLETRDLAIQTGPSIPWYQPLIGSGFSPAGFRRSRPGRWITQNLLKVSEALHISPKGSARVAATLDLCGEAMIEAGRLRIFTPMYFIHARKPK